MVPQSPLRTYSNGEFSNRDLWRVQKRERECDAKGRKEGL